MAVNSHVVRGFRFQSLRRLRLEAVVAGRHRVSRAGLV